MPTQTRKWTCVLTCALLGSSILILPGAEAGDHAPGSLFRWRPFLAPFHSVVLHFPIGFLTMAGILEIYRFFSPGQEIRKITALALWLGLLTGVMSATFGIMRAGSGEYDPRGLELHRIYGMAVPAVTLLALLMQWKSNREGAARAWCFLYRGSIAGTLALVVVAGHLGGNLTHGSKYLVEHAPGFVRELMEEPPSPEVGSETVRPDEQESVYEKTIRPLLQKRCQSCHGPEKQKGGYRVDSPHLALKGGDSGKQAIKPGDPLGSYLLQLILLPPQHDDVMPPDGKQALSLEEIMTLLDWIRHGAHFPAAQRSDGVAGSGTDAGATK